MKSIHTTALVGLGLFVAASGATAQGVADAYTLVELQRLDPANPVRPAAINNSGIVVGWSTGGSTDTAVVFAADGSVVSLVLPGNPSDTIAIEINDEGYILYRSISDDESRVLKPTGESLILQAPQGYHSPYGWLMNASGEVGGRVKVTLGPDEFESFPAIWRLTPNGYEAEVLDDEQYRSMSVLSDSGLICLSETDDVFGQPEAWVYDLRTGDELTRLTSEIGVALQDVNSKGHVMYAGGQGASGIFTQIYDATMQGGNQRVYPMGCENAAPGAYNQCESESQMTGVAFNGHDVVVGFGNPVALDPDGWPDGYEPETSFIWSAESGSIRLESLVVESDLVGWSLDSPIDINDAGWIIGNGTKDGEDAAFLLIPREACAGDVNRDGEVTPTDFTAWINAFNSGCD